MLSMAVPATFLLNSPYGPDGSGITGEVQKQIIDKHEARGRCHHVAAKPTWACINTIMQTCFFVSDMLPTRRRADQALDQAMARRRRKDRPANAAVDAALATCLK